MYSITGKQPGRDDDPRLLLRSECRGLLDLFVPTAMRRVPYYLLAVALTRADLRRFDLLLHKLIGGDVDGPLTVSYYVRADYTSEPARSLDEVLSNELLPDVVYELIVRLEDNRRSIEVVFSRRGVVCRIIGGAFDESWEAEAQKAVSAFLAGKRAKFLAPLFAPVIFLLGGAFYVMYGMAVGPNGADTWTQLFYGAYSVTGFSSGVLFWLHQRGTFFPHAKIAIRDSAEDAGSGNNASLTGVLSLTVEVVHLIADYFSRRARPSTQA